MGQRRKPELFLVVLEYYPFSPSSPLSALSLEPGRQEKTRPGPPTLPVNTTTLLGRIPVSSAQPSPTPCLILQAQRSLSTKRCKVPKQGLCPPSNFLAKTVTVRWSWIPLEASTFLLSSFPKLVKRKPLATSFFSILTLVERDYCLERPLMSHLDIYLLVCKGIGAQVPISNSRAYTSSLDISSPTEWAGKCYPYVLQKPEDYLYWFSCW